MFEPVAVTVAGLPAVWREKAAELRPFSPFAAVAFEQAAVALEGALRAAGEQTLTLAAAASESGYSVEHLRHLVGAGTVVNAGRKGRPLIRRADLPKKATRPTTPTLYDVNADARRLASGGGAR